MSKAFVLRPFRKLHLANQLWLESGHRHICFWFYFKRTALCDYGLKFFVNAFETLFIKARSAGANVFQFFAEIFLILLIKILSFSKKRTGRDVSDLPVTDKIRH